MAETCLLGPSVSDHIRCPHWSDTIVLVQTPSGIAVKSKRELEVDGHVAGAMEMISDGQVVSGGEIRFRLEPLS